MTATRNELREQCLDAAAEIYAGILSDPERLEQIRAHRDAQDAAEKAEREHAGRTA